ncbi:MAG: nickel pincer cofactor biosynthesis protein LarC [Synergistaceae bacterium]|nr:nickel pincer cofactor biosynthesis protein LarC [Synergistaceae bacterium]
MKTLYLDCFAGIAGDMLVGALFEFAPNLDRLRAELAKMTKLSTSDYEIQIEKDVRGGIAGNYFCVKTHEHHPHRGLKEIEDIVVTSALSTRIQREAMRAFALLAEAEAKVHGVTPEEIHFHEVGAIDSIVDIVGAFILIDQLEWPRVLCSTINVGSGTVTCAHGLLPVPTPATEILLHGLPVCSRGEPMERTTPTGALLVRCLADGFCEIPEGTILTSGYGLGTRKSDLPNLLRVLLMECKELGGQGVKHDRVTLLESNIDDMNPQDFELVTERLFEEGALDVWLESIDMKKGRPGVKFCCLCSPEKAEALSWIVLRDTTTQGVRRATLDRSKLCYKIDEVFTSLGALRVKTAFMGENPIRRTPEYDDIKHLAKEKRLPLSEIRNQVLRELPQ